MFHILNSEEQVCRMHLSTNILFHEDGQVFKYMCGGIGKVPQLNSNNQHSRESIFQVTLFLKIEAFSKECVQA